MSAKNSVGMRSSDALPLQFFVFALQGGDFGIGDNHDT